MDSILQHAVDDILQEDENSNLSAKSEPRYHEKRDSEINEKYLYDLDKLSLDDSHKEWHTCTFESKI